MFIGFSAECGVNLPIDGSYSALLPSETIAVSAAALTLIVSKKNRSRAVGKSNHAVAPNTERVFV